MNKLFYLIISFFLFETCSFVIEDYKQSTSQRFLTIEAELTNLEGKSFVHLKYSSEKIVNGVVFFPIERASVSFIDQDNQVTELPEYAAGEYKPLSSFVGIKGKSYKLKIVTSEGETYESKAETMPDIVPLDSLYDEFKESTQYAVGYPKRYNYDVYVDFKDKTTENDYYQWTATHYKQIPYCGFATNRIYNCCERCFDIFPNSQYQLLTDRYINGNTVKRNKIAEVPFGDLTRYYLLIEHRHISASTYHYFATLKQQAQGSGTLFDVPPLTIFSPNIQSIKNPSEKILGIWNVFAAIQKPFIIERNKVVIKEYIPQPPVYNGSVDPFYCEPCRESSERTKIVPPGWR